MFQKPLTRKEYIDRLNDWFKRYQIDNSLCHVSHGGSLLMLGLREITDDIDLTVDKSVWDKFIDMGFEVKTIPASENYPEVRIITGTDEYVDVHMDANSQFELACVDGIYYRDALSTLKDKLALNRDKDQEDILKLREYLNKG